MTFVVNATYDGEVLKPETPLGLEPNTRVRVTIEAEEKQKGEPYSFFRKARELKLQGPKDWSERLDEYLYGDND